MKNKRRIVSAVCIGLFAVIAASLIVFAYFTSEDAKRNDITIADNITEISEIFEPPADQTEGDNVFKKEVRITNTGASPCFVRVFADFSNSFVRNRSYISDSEDTDDLTFYSAKRILKDDDEITTFPEHTNEVGDWVFIPDDSETVLRGYYYYTKKVEIGESTPVLFTYIKTNNPTEDDIDQYDILVYSESAQTTDSDGAEYEDYVSAWTDQLN